MAWAGRSVEAQDDAPPTTVIFNNDTQNQSTVPYYDRKEIDDPYGRRRPSNPGFSRSSSSGSAPPPLHDYQKVAQSLGMSPSAPLSTLEQAVLKGIGVAIQTSRVEVLETAWHSYLSYQAASRNLDEEQQRLALSAKMRAESRTKLAALQSRCAKASKPVDFEKDLNRVQHRVNQQIGNFSESSGRNFVRDSSAAVLKESAAAALRAGESGLAVVVPKVAGDTLAIGGDIATLAEYAGDRAVMLPLLDDMKLAVLNDECKSGSESPIRKELEARVRNYEQRLGVNIREQLAVPARQAAKDAALRDIRAAEKDFVEWLKSRPAP
jgi:hypothetical protein